MADDVEGQPPPGISALPPPTVRQLGSHQLLTDPSSVVKELIDNALDARAKSIFIDITASTIDSIQVKDDGHGIPNEDRALACRRYCTSKIRDFHDLKQVGGKWLGFRGEALASISDMSGTISITTRVEGESVAVKLTYNRNGELVSTERASHPVGTTVKVTKLLESAKVRKELAIKNSSRCLVKIRRLMQTYALARPAVRFRLHVLKAKNNKGDFVYAPKANANVEDAAFKVISKDCALQCDWTALELGGFDIQAFLPKSNAVGSKIANYGAFISIDSRPVSAVRGAFKKIASAVRNKLRKANPTLANVRDPFFCMNLLCPVDSYDPNIEPAKDDVIFSDESFVIALVDQLLASYYPEHLSGIDSADQMESEGAVIQQRIEVPDVEELLPQPQSPVQCFLDQNSSNEDPSVPPPAPQIQQPRWRSSMYGIDEEDLELLRPDTPFAIDEEEGGRDVAVSNPWTIARMNAPVKPNETVGNAQLLSPAKSQGDVPTVYRSPTPFATPDRSKPLEPVTPRTTPLANVEQSRIDDELHRGIQRLPPVPSPNVVSRHHESSPRNGRVLEVPSFHRESSAQPAHRASVSDSSYAGRVKPRHGGKSRAPFKNTPFPATPPRSDDTWFGQPMRNAPKATRSQKRTRQRAPTIFPTNDTYSSQRSLVLPAAECFVETRLASGNNTDIRSFFGKTRHDPADGVSSAKDRNTQQSTITHQLRGYVDQGDPVRAPPRRPQSADSYQRSVDTPQAMDEYFQLHQRLSPGHSSSSMRRLLAADTASPARSTPPMRRRRTADDGLHRTKSSTLPLNYVPHGFETQALSLTVDTSVSIVAHHTRGLDMTASSLEWGYDSMDAFDVFSSPISERKIMEWVIKIDSLLGANFERVDGVEVRGALHEGIQRFIDARKEEEEEGGKYAVVTTSHPISDCMDLDHIPRNVDRGVDQMSRDSFWNEEDGLEQADDKGKCSAAGWTVKTAAIDTAVESDEYEGDSNPSQVIDVEGGEKHDSPMRNVKTEDEFGDGIDDDMLFNM